MEQPTLIPNGDHQEFFDSVPPGIYFTPTDHQLVDLLRLKASDQPLKSNQIYDVEFYNFSPDLLTREENINRRLKEKKPEWYFFTPRDRKFPNGYKPRRSCAEGFWKSTGPATAIKFNEILVAFKRTLKFHKGKEPKGDFKTEWIMDEFVLVDPPKRPKRDVDDVIRITAFKRTLEFHKGKEPMAEFKIEWIMDEFVLVDPAKQRKRVDDDMRLDDWVAVRLYKDTGDETSSDEIMEEEDDEDGASGDENREEDEDE